MKKDSERQCPVCGDPIYGRVDKKFCSDSCRNSFNNERHSASSGIVQNINRVLKKNYAILQELNTKDKTKVKRSKLLQAGFDFTYHTELYKTKKGAEYKKVYDQAYLELEDEFYLLVKWGND